MIRFVDLRGQNIGKRFAFWDDAQGAFIIGEDGNGEEGWDTFEEFAASMDGDDLIRFYAVCPGWVNDAPRAKERRELERAAVKECQPHTQGTCPDYLIDPGKWFIKDDSCVTPHTQMVWGSRDEQPQDKHTMTIPYSPLSARHNMDEH